MLACRFHGLEFSADGRCVGIPAEQDARIPDDFSLPTLSVVEADGYLWLWLGPETAPEARPALPRHAALEGLHWGQSTTIWPAHYTRCIENVCDFSHLPFVHRIVEYLADYTPPTPWFPAGQVLNLGEQRSLLAQAGLADAALVALEPSGQRIPVSEGARAGFITLEEQGFYEIHDASTTAGRPLTLAVNVDLAESDLATVDPETT